MTVARLADPARLYVAWRVAHAIAVDGRRRERARQEVLIAAEMERQGITARLVAVDALMRTAEFIPAFLARFDAVKDAPDGPKNESDVRDLAFEVVRELGGDTTDVNMVVFLYPDGRIRFGPEGEDRVTVSTPAARQRCIDALDARAAEILAAGTGQENGA